MPQPHSHAMAVAEAVAAVAVVDRTAAAVAAGLPGLPAGADPLVGVDRADRSRLPHKSQLLIIYLVAY